MSNRKYTKISDISEILLKCEDILDIKERRKENWNYIMKSLDNKKVIPLYNEKSEDFIPFSFPGFGG